MRVFIAADISDEVRQTAARRIEFLRERFSHLRVGWDKPEKLHLTLKFVGDIDARQLPDLTAAVGKSVKDLSPFEIAIENAGAFPPIGAARVLWLGVKDEGGSLQKLYRRLEQECSALGFEKSEYDFRAHLTIARLKEPQKSHDLTSLHLQTAFPAKSFAVSKITVYQTTPAPPGSAYSPLAESYLSKENS